VINVDEIIHAEPGEHISNFMSNLLKLAEDTKKAVMGNHNERIIIIIPQIYKKEDESDELEEDC